eukprot:308110-Pleurochrysis_carterae.AAC.1
MRFGALNERGKLGRCRTDTHNLDEVVGHEWFIIQHFRAIAIALAMEALGGRLPCTGKQAQSPRRSGRARAPALALAHAACTPSETAWCRRWAREGQTHLGHVRNVNGAPVVPVQQLPQASAFAPGSCARCLARQRCPFVGGTAHRKWVRDALHLLHRALKLGAKQNGL